jgi:integrase
MPRQMERLVPLNVGRETKPGMYADGGGLNLQITKTGVKSWIFRYAVDGKGHLMGLGPLHTVSLAEAREKARDCRKLLLAGTDPIEARNKTRQDARAAKAKAISFKQCAEKYIDAHKAGWKSEKHADQWTATLEQHAFPVFGDLRVSDIDLGLVLKAIEPIWKTKTTTAARVRGRVESVLDWATVRGYRTGENPARWRGHLDKLLPALAKVHTPEHHRALPIDEMGSFMTDLKKQKGTAALALQFAILTAARTSEVIKMVWSEIDMQAAMWTVPKERMKSGKEHSVPLCKQAIQLLTELEKAKHGLYVFPGPKDGKPLSNMAMAELLKRMGRTDITVHGFRSTFRDWVAERTNFPSEVAEMALAHAVSDKVEAAYRRGALLLKRQKMMEAWQRHCNTLPVAGKVVQLDERRA